MFGRLDHGDAHNLIFIVEIQNKIFLQACGRVCLGISACVAFELSVNERKCNWYSTNFVSPLTALAGYQYYTKIMNKVVKTFQIIINYT